jgi:hypothetical protein
MSRPTWPPALDTSMGDGWRMTRGVAGGIAEEDRRCRVGFGGCSDAGVEIGLGAAGVDTVARSSATSGDSKSHTTPCFRQFPHRGWTSSHWGQFSMGEACRWEPRKASYLDLADLAPPTPSARLLVGPSWRHGSELEQMLNRRHLGGLERKLMAEADDDGARNGSMAASSFRLEGRL